MPKLNSAYKMIFRIKNNTCYKFRRRININTILVVCHQLYIKHYYQVVEEFAVQFFYQNGKNKLFTGYKVKTLETEQFLWHKCFYKCLCFLYRSKNLNIHDKIYGASKNVCMKQAVQPTDCRKTVFWTK